MRSEIEIIEACLHTLRTGQPDRAPLTPDVTWTGPPVSRPLAGAEVTGLLVRFLPLVENLRAERHIVEGPYVASLLEIESAAGKIPAFVYFRLSNGLIKEIRTFYDPRLIFPEKFPGKEWTS